MKRILSEEQEKEIGQLYVKGDSRLSLGKRYGVCETTIARALSRQGITTRPVGGVRIFSDEQKKEIIRLYLSGISGDKISKRYSMGYLAFQTLLSSQGVIMRPSHPRALSGEQEKEVGRLYIEGDSCPSIGKRYGVSKNTIASALSRQGIATHSMKTFSDEQEREIAKKYLEGENSTDLSKEYGVSHHTIIRAMSRQGVNPRLSFMEKVSAGVISGEEIGKLYLDGVSATQVGEKFNVDRHTIKKVLQQQGIKMRSRHDACMKHSLNENAFNVLNDKSAYWLGFMMADGNVCLPSAGGQPKIAIGLNVKDKAHVEKFRSFLRSTHKISYYKKNNAVNFAVSSQKLADSLAAYNIVPRKSFIATAPDALVNEPNFWRGLIDGDGTVAINKDGCPLVTLYGSYSIVNQFSKFIKSYEPKCRATVAPRGNIGSVTAYGRYATHILWILYHDASVSLNRKAATARKIDERFGNKSTRTIKMRSAQCT